MKFLQLKQHILSRQFFPCYVAAGEDSYLIKKCEQMLSDIIEVKELNISVLPEGATFDALQNAMETLPFISDYRLVIVDGIKTDSLKKYLDAPVPSTIVLIKGGDAQKLPAGVEHIDCDRLDSATLIASVIAECQKNGANIQRDAAALLVEYCLRFMGRIRTELHKLISLRAGGVIVQDDVKEMVLPELEYKIFELSSAIVRKNGQKSLALLDDMLSSGYGASAKVFGLLYSHFRRLLAVSLSPNNPDIAKHLDIKDYAAKVAVQESKAFSRLKLKQIVDRLSRLDADIKSGRINDKVGLQTFVMQTLCDVGA